MKSTAPEKRKMCPLVRAQRRGPYEDISPWQNAAMQIIEEDKVQGRDVVRSRSYYIPTAPRHTVFLRDTAITPVPHP